MSFSSDPEKPLPLFKNSKSAAQIAVCEARDRRHKLWILALSVGGGILIPAILTGAVVAAYGRDDDYRIVPKPGYTVWVRGGETVLPSWCGLEGEEGEDAVLGRYMLTLVVRRKGGRRIIMRMLANKIPDIV